MLEPIIYIRKVSLGHNEVVQYSVCAAGEYIGDFKDEIRQFKYYGERNLGSVFGERIYENLPKNYYDLSDYDFLLPIPSSPSSLSKRGYDQVRLIGERLSELCGLPLVRDILESLDRPAQVNLSAADRNKNVKDSFRLIDPSRVEGKGILVLDDVFTTGSTLNEVVRILSTAAPRQLDALVLAKVPPPYDPRR